MTIFGRMMGSSVLWPDTESTVDPVRCHPCGGACRLRVRRARRWDDAAMPELGGHDLLREWQAAMRSLAGHADLPRQLLAPLQRQAELIQEILERERRLQRDVVNRLLGPADAIFDLLEQSGEALHQQAEALEEAGRALEQTAALVKAQADLFERTVRTIREPTELAKAAAGIDRRPARKHRPRSS
jgi:hypothetical protein